MFSPQQQQHNFHILIQLCTLKYPRHGKLKSFFSPPCGLQSSRGSLCGAYLAPCLEPPAKKMLSGGGALGVLTQISEVSVAPPVTSQRADPKKHVFTNTLFKKARKRTNQKGAFLNSLLWCLLTDRAGSQSAGDFYKTPL